MGKKRADMTKICLIAHGTDWHGMTAERVWASPLVDGLFLVRNNPLYAYGISYGDVVRCREADDGSLQFEHVAKQGGHSNYRLLLKAGRTPSDFLAVWPRLEQLGCSYESSRDPEDVFAIDVPPTADVAAVYSVITEGEEQGLWYLDEGNFEHGCPDGTG